MARMTSWALVCATMTLISTVHGRGLLQAGKQRFPPYACETNPALSPFRLEGAYTTTPSPNGQRVCLRGAAVQPCPPGNPCCSQADFYKLELRVNPQCRNAIRGVTVNGKMTPLPTFEVFGAGRSQALFKMPKLNLTTENVTGAMICFTLRDPCPNMAALCPEGDGRCMYSVVQSGPCKCCPVNQLGFFPPPPAPSPKPPSPPPPSTPPPPGTPPTRPPSSPLPSAQPLQPKGREPPPASPGSDNSFPFCQCNKTAAIMPFTLAGAPVASRTAAGNNMYCFSLQSAACVDPSSPCCQSDLLKVEWWSMDTCRGSVAAAYINKSKYPITWDQGGTFRLTKLGFRASDLAASSKQLCIELRQGSPCDTIDKFCNKRQCTCSLFDQSKTCCPTSAVPKA